MVRTLLAVLVVALLAASPSVALGQQFVEVLAPTGGEVIPWDYSFEIRWTSGGFAGNVDIEISETGPNGPFRVFGDSQPNTGSFNWHVDPADYPASPTYSIRVMSEDEPAISAISGVFEVGGFCGTGALDEDEACDDGNIAPGDGCDPSCQVEPGWWCETEPWWEPSVCSELTGVPVLSPLAITLLGTLLGLAGWRRLCG